MPNTLKKLFKIIIRTVPFRVQKLLISRNESSRDQISEFTSKYQFLRKRNMIIFDNYYMKSKVELYEKLTCLCTKNILSIELKVRIKKSKDILSYLKVN